MAKGKEFFEYKTDEMAEIIKDCEKGNYGIVFVQSVPEYQANRVMDLEMQGYSIEEFDDEVSDDIDERYNPNNFILTMVKVNNGQGIIRVMEITSELAKEVKKYQEYLRGLKKNE